MKSCGEDSKIKLGWMSDNPCTNTGFSSVSREVLNRLNKMPDYNCKMMGHNFIGQTLKKGTQFIDGSEIDFELHPGGREPFGKDVISWWIKNNKLDIFGVLLDTFMVFPWFNNLDMSPAKTFFYFPSDGEGRLPHNCESILKKVDMPIAMSKFGQRQAWKVHGIKTEYIPHAVDRNLFYKLEDDKIEELKIKWGMEGKFIVGTVARNQGRKMLDRGLKAFSKFAEGKDDVMYLFHTDPEDVASVFNILELIQRYKLQNKVIFTGTKYYKGFTYHEMNEVYNIMDVHLLSTSGEGFGIPTIEASACGVPSLVTNFTTTQELLVENGVCGIPIKCLGTELDSITGSWNVERGIMSVEDCKDKLNLLYNDRKLVKKLGNEGVIKVEKYYDWDKVAKDFDKLLKKLVKI